MSICQHEGLPNTNDVQRTQYVNAQNTFKELLNMGVIPIVNENDTLAVSVSTASRKYLAIEKSNVSFRKSNSVTTTRYRPSLLAWSGPTTSS